MLVAGPLPSSGLLERRNFEQRLETQSVAEIEGAKPQRYFLRHLAAVVGAVVAALAAAISMAIFAPALLSVIVAIAMAVVVIKRKVRARELEVERQRQREYLRNYGLRVVQ